MTCSRVLRAGLLLVAMNVAYAQDGADARANALRTDVATFAHDSMLGRPSGSEAAFRIANAIGLRLQAAGIRPGIKNSYYQDVPLVLARLDAGNSVMTNHVYQLNFGVDYLPVPGFDGIPLPRSTDVSAIVFGGRLGTNTAIDPMKARRKLAVMLPPLRANGQPEYQVWGKPEWLRPYFASTAIAVVGLELMPPSMQRMIMRPHLELKPSGQADTTFPAVVMITRATASLLLGKNADAAELSKDTIGSGGGIKFRVAYDGTPRPARNVVGIIEGSDPALKSQYVVLSARLDGDGVQPGDGLPLSSWPFDADSILNGADESTGAVALLHIAERMARDAVRPKRSVMFLWTVGDDAAQGAQWFVEHPPVSRDNIVANVTVGPVGRGGANDTRGGGPDHVQVVGSDRASRQFGEWIAEANATSGNMRIDYTLDLPGAPASEFCKGNQWQFARRGIPSALITTGAHADTRTVRDDLERVDFGKLARLTDLIAVVALDLANRPSRPVIDKPRPDPTQPCS